MYVGHFAAGLAIKAYEPKAPTWALLVAVGLLDLLFGPFVLAGLERATVTPGISPGFSLDHIDWSHSLMMSVLWAVLFAAAFSRLGRPVVLAIGFAVFSHFLMDLPVHPPDLALWPDATVHLGLGLWRRWPIGWWFLELAVMTLLWGYYWRRSRAHPSFGAHPFIIAAVLLGLHVFNSPWLSQLQ